jgi:hypothetical protein
MTSTKRVSGNYEIYADNVDIYGNLHLATGNIDLGSNANVKISGGSAGNFLKTDGNSNLSWSSTTSIPAGFDTQVQFNDGGSFNGSAGLTFNKTTGTLNVTKIAGSFDGPIGASSLNVGAFTSVTATGIVVASQVNAATIGNIGAFLTGTLQTGTQTNITSVGTLSSLAVSGNASAGNLTVTGVGGQVRGYHTGAIGANVPNSGVFTSVTTTSSGQLIGYHTGAIGANSANTGAFTTTIITDSTNATNLQSGAFQVSQGGASIQKDLWVGGNIYGNITSQVSTILSVNDPLLYLNASSPENYNYDIGFYSHFYGGAANNYQHSGLIRNFQDNVWYLFSNVPEPSAGDVNVTYANVIYDSLKLGTLTVANTKVSTSTSTGAIVSSGGVGIAGNLFVGGGINGVIGNVTPASGSFTTLTSTSQTNLANTAVSALYTTSGVFWTGNGVAFTSGSGGGSGTPGGATTNVQFNDAGSFNGTGGFTFDKITSAVTITGNTSAGNLSAVGLGGQVRGYLTGAIGANIANTGAFTTINASSTATITGNTTVGNLSVTGVGGQVIGYHTGAIGANIPNSGSFTTLTATSTVNLGSNANITITGGTSGTFLRTDGAGGLSWATPSAGVGTPGGSTTQIQFNDAGVFGGGAGLTFNKTTNAVVMSGNVTAGNAIVSGLYTTGGIYWTGNGAAWTSSGGSSAGATTVTNPSIYLGKTTVTTTPTLVDTLPLSGNALVRWTTTSKDNTNSRYALSTIDSLNDGTNVYFTQYGVIQSNSSYNVSVFTSNVSAGNINLYATGDSSNTTITFERTVLGSATSSGYLNASASIVGGSDTNVQFNDAGLINGTAGFAFNKTANSVTMAGNVTVGNLSTTGVGGQVIGYITGAIGANVANTGVFTTVTASSGLIGNSSNISLVTNTETNIDSFSTSLYRTAKYIVSTSDFTNSKYQTTELLVNHNGTTATIATYGIVATGGSSFVTFNVSVSGSTVYVKASSTSVASYCKIQQTYIPV